MLNMYKNKGVTLVELMVALSLGILLMFSMLAFYSVTQQNLITHTTEQKKQQELRKLFHLLSRNIENTGAFECAQTDTIFRDIGSITNNPSNNATHTAAKNNINRINIKRFPKNIISLGSWAAWQSANRQQFIFVHPIDESNLDRSLGIMDIQENEGVTTAHYSPIEIQANCGSVNSTVYIGSTIVETVPIYETKRPPITEFRNTETAANDVLSKNVTAFIVMSGLQPRLYNMPAPNPADPNITKFQQLMTAGYDRAYFLNNFRALGSLVPQVPGVGSEYHRNEFVNTTVNAGVIANPGKNQYTFSYLPSIYDGTVAYLSDNNTPPNPNLPFGKNDVVISLGFAKNTFSSSVPDHDMNTLAGGGWLNPYESEDKYNLIMETCNNGGYRIDGCNDGPPSVKIADGNNDTQLINRVLHPREDSVGYEMRTYPISAAAAAQVRAVRFQFILDRGTDNQQIITRVIRFKNTHLKKLSSP